MDRLLAIGEVAQVLEMFITTLRRWVAEGRLVPEHTAGKYQRYDLASLKSELFFSRLSEWRTIAHAYVSSHD